MWLLMGGLLRFTPLLRGRTDCLADRRSGRKDGFKLPDALRGGLRQDGAAAGWPRATC